VSCVAGLVLLDENRDMLGLAVAICTVVVIALNGALHATHHEDEVFWVFQMSNDSHDRLLVLLDL
jgi:hypothetical protein